MTDSPTPEYRLVGWTALVARFVGDDALSLDSELADAVDALLAELQSASGTTG